jgi:hypothetical protein
MLKLIQHLYLIPVFISALLSLKSFRRGWPSHYRTFSILLLCVLFVEVLTYVWESLAKTNGWPFSNNSLWIYNIFLFVQYPLYMLFYYRALTSQKIRRTVIVMAVIYFVFGIMNLIYFQDIFRVNSFTLVVASGIVIFLSLAYFEQVRKSKEIIRLAEHPMVWISLGAFLYHAGCAPYMLSVNFLSTYDRSLAIALYFIYMSLIFVMYSLYTIAFLCNPPPK